METARLFGIPVSRLTEAEAVERIIALAKERKGGRPAQIATLNVDFVANAVGGWPFRGDAELWDILKNADLVTADGMPIVMLSRIMRAPIPGRATGADMVPALCRRCAEEGMTVYVLGGDRETLEAAFAKMAADAQGREGLAPSCQGGPAPSPAPQVEQGGPSGRPGPAADAQGREGLAPSCQAGPAPSPPPQLEQGGPSGRPSPAPNLPQPPRGVAVAGFDPSFVNLAEDQTATVERVNAVSPDILFVALGNPKQELWMARNAGRLRVGAMMGVGGTFNFIAGRVRRAPRWMQRAGLEWVYRICQEPGRLWRRYAYGLVKFSWLSLLTLCGAYRNKAGNEQKQQGRK